MLSKVSKLSILNFLAQVIAVMGFSINANLYGAENLGGLLVVLSYSSIISILSSGYLEQAFFIEKNYQHVKYLLILIGYISLVVCSISGIILLFFNVSYIIYIVLNIINSTILKTVDSYFISQNRIILLSIIKLIFSPLIPLLLFLSFHIYGPRENLLIFITTGGNLLFAIFMLLYTVKLFSLKFFVIDFFKFNLQFFLFKRYIKFVKFSMTGELMRTLAFKGPTIVLEKYFGKEIAGFYGIANRIVLTPILVLVGTVSQIFIQKISTVKKFNNLGLSFTHNILKLLFALSLLGMIIFLLVGEYLLIWLLGESFQEVYYVIIVLLPYAFALMILNPLFSIYTVFEKQEYLFHMKGILLISSVLAFTFAVVKGDFILGLRLFSFSLFLTYLIYAFFAYKILRNHDKEIRKIYTS
ncbi:oligosaccharide flippase family protein [Gillisia sp. JM1]|uniref:oligosaccharide flippase family protein n=1 Tax=Gillisia sp. JM1 TaxID=1283286 RepID=UPI00040E3F19|nr:oligosaccharide flippase family protein [Gillisia sp. JM1]